MGSRYFKVERHDNRVTVTVMNRWDEMCSGAGTGGLPIRYMELSSMCPATISKNVPAVIEHIECREIQQYTSLYY